MTGDIPNLPPTLIGAIGRPFWYEGAAVSERAELARTTVPLADGRGQRVVLVSGYLAGTRSTRPLAQWLRAAGYVVAYAEVGRNAVSSSVAAAAIADALRFGDGPSLLIGHSRGGQQCRVAAYRNPELVSQLITLGSPVRAHYPRAALLRASVEATRLLNLLPVGPNEDPVAETQYERDLFAPFPEQVPWTAIWSKRDGVIEWQACLDPAADSLEVTCSHTGLVASVSSFRAIADVLDAAAGRFGGTE
ncbi:MAG: hypothetical protein AAF531_17190 [Actinomycetota bacterium]